MEGQEESYAERASGRRGDDSPRALRSARLHSSGGARPGRATPRADCSLFATPASSCPMPASRSVAEGFTLGSTSAGRANAPCSVRSGAPRGHHRRSASSARGSRREEGRAPRPRPSRMGKRRLNADQPAPPSRPGTIARAHVGNPTARPSSRHPTMPTTGHSDVAVERDLPGVSDGTCQASRRPAHPAAASTPRPRHMPAEAVADGFEDARRSLGEVAESGAPGSRPARVQRCWNAPRRKVFAIPSCRSCRPGSRRR